MPGVWEEFSGTLTCPVLHKLTGLDPAKKKQNGGAGGGGGVGGGVGECG